MNSYLLIDLIEFSSDDLILKYSHTNTHPRQINKFIFNYLNRIKNKFSGKDTKDDRYSILVELLKTRGCFIFLKDKQFMMETFNKVGYGRYIDNTFCDVLKAIVDSLIDPKIKIDSHIDIIQVFEIVLELLGKYSKHYYMETYNIICNSDLPKDKTIIAKSEVIQYLIDKLLDKQVMIYQNSPPYVLFDQAPGPIKGKRKSSYPSELEYMMFEYEESLDIKDFIVTKDMLRHFHCWICNHS